jgi:protease-4
MWRRGRRAASLAYWAISEAVLRLLGRRKPYGVLVLRLKGEIEEQLAESPLFASRRSGGHDFVDLITLLRLARQDAALRGVFVHCSNLHAGWAQIQELRRALIALREAGKKVWFFLSQGGIHDYVLASAAERIILPPAATLDITGLSSEVTFWTGALAKLGIQAELVQLGKFKSAGEAFTRTDMSPEHRQMIEELLDDLYAQVIARIAEGRGFDEDEVRRIVDGGPFLAAEAVERNLVDALAYEDEAEQELRKQCDDLPTIASDAYNVRRRRWAQREAIQRANASLALIHVTGAIKTGENISGPAFAGASGVDTVARALKSVRERDDVAAVVLRVSSPGGSGFASDLIWHDIARTRSTKPVIVSFGDVAASGGYYIGVAGHPVLAEEGTLTGSIGVLAGKAVLRGLYDRVGVRKEVIKRGRNAGLGSEYLPLSEAERERLSTQAQSMYDRFLDVVAGGRTLSRERVAEVAEGRVWSGRQAQQNGLVDRLGGLEDALAEAKRQAGIPVHQPVFVERYPKPSRWWTTARRWTSPVGGLTALSPWVTFIRGERLWTLMPFRIRFF